MEVTAGRTAGSVHQNISLFSPSYTVRGAEGEDRFTIEVCSLQVTCENDKPKYLFLSGPAVTELLQGSLLQMLLQQGHSLQDRGHRQRPAGRVHQQEVERSAEGGSHQGRQVQCGLSP